MINKMIYIPVIILALPIFSHLGLTEKIYAQEDAETARVPVAGIDATVIGLGEFAPGSTSVIQILVQNNNVIGTIDEVAVQGGLNQLYGSAVGLTAYLEKGNAPVTVKVEKILLGTLRAGEATTPISYIIEVNEVATPGKYEMKLILDYKMLEEVSKKEGKAGVELDWSDRSDTKELATEIREPSLKFEVADIEANLLPGAHKDIKVVFTNSDNKVARDAEAQLSAEGPLSLTQNNSFLGTIRPDETATGTFGLKVAGDAIPTTYALDAVIKYTDENGNEYITKKIKVPIVIRSSLSISEFISSNFVGVIIGLALMGIIWFIMDVLILERSKQKKL